MRESYLQADLDTMKEEYGSIEGFIENGLGMTKEQPVQLQSMYLEKILRNSRFSLV
ncbi:tyrosine-protein phosphatase [Paenibacillus selenitireducens]|uniref:tyrosine-protein phosphatase n=1 Tax=Paenibacillus selenitireducens TaxID=1324314 RepID=UPI0022B85D78|nr:tyrosine-protein phosphatase [Paenibacillus selenitireducens]